MKLKVKVDKPARAGSKRGKRSVKARVSKTPAQKQAEERFVQDLVVRQEAAKPTEDGRLPLEATHVITKDDKKGTAVVKRVRFKLY